jgi:hypothetical protein
VAAETDPTLASELEERSKEHSSSIPTRAVVLAAVVLVGIIVYSYLDMPGSGWIGVANKKFWIVSPNLYAPPRHVVPHPRGLRVPGRHIRGLRRAFYARFCIRTSQDFPSTRLGE